MALSTNDAFSVGGGRRRRGRRRAALAEINVTPLVDVMLVLLIIFMISAPLLTVGVPVDLPKTEASAVNDQTQPLTITVRQDGGIFIQDQQTPFEQLSTRLYISYGISLAEAINTFKARFSLGKGWTLKTESGKARSADLVYTFKKGSGKDKAKSQAQDTGKEKPAAKQKAPSPK